MKDEMASEPISRFVGLKSKMYALEVAGRVKKVGKGVQKRVLKNNVTINNYMKCLRERQRYSFTSTHIRSYNQLMHTIEQKKVCLSSFDDKRFFFPCGTRSVPYGHYLTRKPV